MKNHNTHRIIRFITKLEIQTEKNLENLIIKAKSSNAFGSVVWDEAGWTVTDSQSTDRGHKQREYKLWFTHHGKNSKNIGEAFAEPFGNFVKAFIRLRHEVGNQSCANHMNTVRAFRYLYNELQAQNLNPILLNRDHFIRAEQAVKNREASSTAYRIGIHLTEIARLLDENRLTKIRLDYKTSLKRPESQDRLSPTAHKRREKLLPKEEFFNALATISSQVTTHADKVRMCVIKILVFTGFRIGEALTLPTDTLVVEDGKIGLRYWPEKKTDPRIKWLPTDAGKLVKSAIEELLKLTKDARNMAVWLERHPGQVQISGYHQNDLISTRDIAKIVGIGNGIQFCRVRNIPIIKQANGNSTLEYFAQFKDFYYEIVSKRWDKPMLKLPNGKIQLLSKSLCVVFFEQLSDARPYNPLLVRPISEQNISDFLCGRSTIKNVFERHDYKNHDGAPYKIRTHQFRHFLNTLANEGGLNDVELAWWFGRKNIGDNQAYDHRTATQMTEKARQMLLSGEIIGPISEAASQLTPLEAEEFVATQVNAVHHTPYGLCLHDFAQNPCDKHLNCLSGCKEFHRTKGNQNERTNLKALKNNVLTALKQAKQEANDDTWGANNWVKHNEVIAENIDKALAVDIDENEQKAQQELVPVYAANKMLGEEL